MKNFHFLREPLLICIGAICLIFISSIMDALLCFGIAVFFGLIFLLSRRFHTKKTAKFIGKPLSGNELVPGDTVTLNQSELLTADSILLDSSALFAPAFATPSTLPTEFLQGDEVPSGYRLVSEEPVSLHVTTHYDDSIFTRYMNAFRRSLSKYDDITFASFFKKFYLYSFQKGVLISDNLKKLAHTKAFFIAKSAIIKPSEYNITFICPSKSGMTQEELLTYVARAEIPYANTGIGSTLIKGCSSEILLSAVIHTEKHPGLGVVTQYKRDTIHVGCKELLISSGISKLPNFEAIEDGSNVNDTFIYIALNHTYIGHIILDAPFKNSYIDFLNYLTSKKIFTQVVVHNSSEEADSLVTIRNHLQKKGRTAHVAYIDSKPTDSALRRLSDYNIFLGSGSYCSENDFSDVTIIPSSFKTLFRTIILAKKICRTANFYSILLPLIKVGLITAGIMLPGIQVWHAVLAAGIINTALIKVYDLFFRLFTRFN